ncbi:hypothetical protein K8Q98_00460 [Candidatus Nomurabacteria bacterium]|nr:hypothetical protein [Candidatus Nomurabacteria bacterium]
MKKIIIGVITIIVFLIAVFYTFNAYIYNEKQAPAVTDFKDVEYLIDGASIQLKDGFSEIETAPGAASKITTRYFGNEYMTDLDNDGRKDVVFLLTQDTGGSGVFYYVVAALSTESGYVGSDGYLLGDRIAPQTIEMSPNPKHKNVIVVNYADRALEEPMVAQPSINKSAYLKLDIANMMWGIVEPDFEGESR